MLKKLLMVLFLFSLIPLASADQHPHHRHHNNDNKISAHVVLVMDQGDQSVMMDKNSDQIVPIASITKLMTAMVILDANLPMDEILTIDKDDYKSKIRSRIKVGMKFSRGELLQLALMSSENRAALALARSYPGGINWFIPAMNNKATELEMLDTQFRDPTGLDHGNVSTARDLVKLVKAASSYPLIHEDTTTTSHKLDNEQLRKPLQYHNTNPLVSASTWDIGISKTGTLKKAGRCLVMQTIIDDRSFIIIILHSRTKYSRLNDAKQIKKLVEHHLNLASAEIK